MMGTKTGIVCVLAALAVGACSWGSGSGSGNTAPDASGPAVCGDNICAATEVGFCTQDCGSGGNHGGSNGSNGQQTAVCGNGQCETTLGESATSCPSDCGGNSGSGGALNCSDPNTTIGCGLCSVAMVCTPPYDAVSCAACGGGSAASGCTGGLPDSVCDSMENNTTCPFDCP
jgi:hypothetical protein